MFDSVSPEVPPKLLKELVAAGSVTSAVVRSYPNGWLITLRVGMQERVVGATRGGPRYFKSMDAVTTAIYDAGISDYSVSLANGLPKARARTAESEATP
ncbi:MAG: partition protein C [Burkholderia sp.]|nr:partition protein C [Burkholderia sp.]